MFVWISGELNKEQEAAIFEPESILLVACPGSGKTRTLTYKIAYELSRLKSSREYIIAITYTNAAADEIKERIELLGVNIDQLWIGTIHSFCLEWILRPYYLYVDELKCGFRVLNAHESEEIISTLCAPYKSEKVSYYDCSYMAKKDEFILTSASDTKLPIVKNIIAEYFKILQDRKQIDFELILHYSYLLLRDNETIRTTLCKLFPFVLIDEYQDTKEIQYDIIAYIMSANKGVSKLLIVGDPNQSIFESLGGFPMAKADLENLLKFNLIDYSLSKNYRSSKKIVEYFDYFKTYNNSIVPSGKNKDYPSIITFNQAINKEQVVDEVVRLIKYNVSLGISPHEICIAAPQWVHLSSLTRKLMVKLPDYSFDGPGMAPFSRDIDNFWYKLSRIVLTEPSPNLYVKRLRWAREILDELNGIGANTDLTSKSFLKLCNSIDIDEAEGLKYLELVFTKVLDLLQLRFEMFTSLKEQFDSFFRSSDQRIEKLESEGITYVGTTENFRKVFKQREGITVSTVHGVKGEEYDTVIGFAILDEYIPFFSDTNKEVNSKRMLYVLSSRARKNLHIISERGRKVHATYKPNGVLPTPQLLKYRYQYDII